MTQLLNTQIRGLLPALDARQVQDKYVISGRNFLVDAEGAYSAFGSNIIAYGKINDPKFAQTFRVGTDIILVNSEGFWIYDDSAHAYYALYVLDTPATEVYPWSMALVGGKYYFVKKGSSLIEYAPVVGTWQVITQYVPTNPHAVAESLDRLIVVGKDSYAWSEISNGANLNPQEVDKGIGIQDLAIIGGGDVYGVFPISSGFLVYTSRGIAKAEIIQSTTLTYRHYPLTTQIRAIGPYSIIVTNDDEIIFMSKTGLYITAGDKPEVYQPLMSEFFRRKLLPQFGQSITSTNVIRLTYNNDKSWLIVSVSPNAIDYNYDYAYVLYLPRDEWGVFNRTHYGFGETNLTLAVNEGFNFGYFTPDGYLRKFIGTPQVETFDIDSQDYYLKSEIMDIPAQEIEGVTAFRVDMLLTTRNPEDFSASGFYEFTASSGAEEPSVTVAWTNAVEGTPNVFTSNIYMSSLIKEYMWTPHERTYDSINSEITIGAYRISDEIENDLITTVVNVAIGSAEISSLQGTIEDWLLITPDIEIDWLTEPEEVEDWGLSVPSGSDYDIKLIGTVDGFNVYEDQEDIPELYEEAARAKYFTCYNSGIYHIINIKAEEIGYNFHIKLADLKLIGSGRLI